MSASETIITAGSTLLAAFGGVFFGAWLQQRFQLRSEQRRSHLKDIKEGCLIPLKESLDKFYVDELWLSEDRPQFDRTIADPPVLNKALEVIKAQTDVLTLGSEISFKLDRVLLNDLSNHFGAIKTSVDRLDTGLNGRYEEYKRTLYTSFSRIYQLLMEKRSEHQVPPDNIRFHLLARAVFYESIDKPVGEWPGLYNATTDQRLILEQLANDVELKRLGKKFMEQHKVIGYECSTLREQLELAIDSYRSLNGSCTLID